jgi:hypothetical protein
MLESKPVACDVRASCPPFFRPNSNLDRLSSHEKLNVKLRASYGFVDLDFKGHMFTFGVAWSMLKR